MGNEALPITRARFGIGAGPQVTSRFGLVNFFAHVLAPLRRTALAVLEMRHALVPRRS